ncbi:DUF551 domain-containing protein [Escherichia fergusonii]|nr:DUF551 domain-containing protein [Escherichia fergusonii]
MSTITKERIELFIKSPLENGLTRGEQMELARIALASLEAEPVAWKVTFTQIDREYNTFTGMYSDKAEVERWVRLHKVGDFRADITPLYTAKPVPIVPGEIADDLMEKLPKSDAWANGFRGGWNSCRAVMLHGAEPVSQTYKLPVNTPCQDAPSHIWLQTAGVWPEDGELSELTWCSHNQHHDDTLYVRADLVNGNSPVTPDGWISCSERMPDKLIPVMVMYEDGEMWSAMWNGNRWDDGTEYPDPHSVTHWREMPAAPQQEVK